MAKWGEGDPRWIVEDRPDATNVNNWHWTMKDASVWSKGILKDFIVGLKFESPSIGNWNIKEMSSMEGEASASNRKGNLIILYDWTIKAKIKGSSSDGKEDEGTINIFNFCDENEISDIEIDVSLDKNSSSLLRDIAKHSRPILSENLEKYVTLLKNHYSQGVILPSHNKTESINSTNKTCEPSKHKKQSTQSTVTKLNGAVKISTKKVELKELFKCSCEELYNVFVTEELVSAFTKSQATVNGHKGGTFAFMNGQITGQFVELDRPNKIVEKWRSKNWPDGHYSNVTFQFQQNDDGTQLILKQTGVPESDHERTKDGWKRYIFEPIKHTFGYGAALF